MKIISKFIKAKDWHICKISDIANLSSGTTPSRQKNDLYFKNGCIPWVKTGDLNNSNIYRTDEKVTTDALKLSALKKHPEDTILLAMYGGFNQIGRTGLLKIEATTNQAITAILIKNKNSLIPSFLQTYLNFRVDDWKQFAGSSRKDPNISKKDIENFLIPIPPIAEQRKIAEILGTCDRQIELTEKLIETKRKLKQGLMEKIFSQEIRFKQDNGAYFPDWKKKKLHQICEKIGDGIHSTPQYDVNGEFYFINGNNLIDSQIKFTNRTKKVSIYEYFRHKVELTDQTILMSINGTIQYRRQ